MKVKCCVASAIIGFVSACGGSRETDFSEQRYSLNTATANAPDEISHGGKIFKKTSDKTDDSGRRSDSGHEAMRRGARSIMVVADHRDATYISEEDADIEEVLENGGKTSRKRTPDGNLIVEPLRVPEPKWKDAPSESKQLPGGGEIVPGDSSGSCGGVTPGGDQRTGVFGAQQTQFPYAQQIYFTTNEGTCSGTMIGWNTMLTAAHCIWNSSTNQWKWPQKFIPGHNAASSTPKPFGEYTCWNTMSRPGNYPGDGYRADFATVTFDGCGGPGQQTGWMGWWTNAPQQDSVYDAGYPSVFYFQSAFPELAVSGGTYSIDTPQLVSANLDVSKGDSGSAWFAWPDGPGTNTFVIGNWHSYECPWWLVPGGRAWAKRLDTTVETFIKNTTLDF
jgi:V8-like Glu-specific endopeptidase